jgi:tetratricopeptide (TPR) repeat protein
MMRRMIGRCNRLLLSLSSVFLVFVLAPSRIDAQSRVPFPEALTHLVKRVDPIAPPQAAAAKVGGMVYADVVIRADGTVEAVEIVNGAEMLRPVVINALKQWTFKPFLENGKPARVMTLAEVAFPDPVRDEERRIYEGFRTAEFECRRASESFPQSAVEPCQQAVDFSRQLPVERQLERSGAISNLGQALFINRRFGEALSAFEEGLAIRQKSAGLNDEGTAAMFELVGLTHFALKEFAKADQAMASSVNSYEKAIETLPTYRAMYTPRLQAVLRRFAEMKNARGEVAEARVLNDKADSLNLPPAAPKAPEVIAGIRYMGPPGSFLTETDVQRIRSLIPNGAPSPWLLVGKEVGLYGPLTWNVEVYLGPEVNSAGFRMGQLMTLTTKLGAPDAFAENKAWEQRTRTELYGQEFSASNNPGEVENFSDRRMPFGIVSLSNEPKLKSEEVQRILAFIHGRAIKDAVPAAGARLSTDIQPWGIVEISRWSGNEIQVLLREPGGRRIQQVRIRMDAAGLTLLELR